MSMFDTNNNTIASFDRAASNTYGSNYGDSGYTLNDYMNSKGGWFNISKKNNPFSKGNLGGMFGKSNNGSGSQSSANWGAAGKAALGALLGVADSIGQNEDFKRGLWDRADPLHHLADGHESSVGNAFGDVGVGLFKQGVMSGNLPLMAIGGIAKGLGSGYNALLGTKVNKERLNAVNDSINRNWNYMATADNVGDESVASFTNTNIYHNAGLRGNSDKRKNAEKKRQLMSSIAFVDRSKDNAIYNRSMDTLHSALGNLSAYGGFLGQNNDMGILDYNMMSDYMTYKQKQVDNKNTIQKQPSNFITNTFGIGGDLQTNGADFSTGLVHINAGGSHESNPYQGVQLGVDSKGVPNLVEENEVIYDDYVYSDRILLDDITKSKFHFSKKKDITYAEAAKKLENEIKERPNDPISKAGFNSQIRALAEEQERQKQLIEAEKARAAFESMSPEEQVAVVQQKQEQDALMQQQMMAMQQQAYEQQISVPQEQQAITGLMQEEPIINSCGGKINRFDEGGFKNNLYKAIGWATDDDFYKWANANKLAGATDWSDQSAITDDQLRRLVTTEAAMKKLNPALVHAIQNGYDFGAAPSVESETKYDFGKLFKLTNNYSKQNGNTSGKYKPDPNRTKEQVKELEGTEAYKAFTNYILNSAPDDIRSDYFNWIERNTGGTPRYIKDGNLVANWKDLYTAARNDGLDGIQHLTPEFININPEDVSTSYVWNDDKKDWDLVIGNIGKDWTKDNTYTWNNDKGTNTINYYKRPVVGDTRTEKGDKGSKTKPIIYDESYRKLGLLGPAVSLGLMGMGVGKPDFSGMDKVVSNTGNVQLADYKPIGNYLQLDPMDIVFEQNRMDANARATDRAITNNSAPIGTRIAGLLASGYNNNITDGELHRKALEYNAAQKQKEADFNRGTDMFNAEAYNKLSQFNAGMTNQGRELQTKLAMQAAEDKINADNAWYQSLYGNIGELFNNYANYGLENARLNARNRLAADGFTNLGDSYTGQGMITQVPDEEENKKYGGKIKRRKSRKRGLTI